MASVRWCPEVLTPLDWDAELRKPKVAYDGEEVDTTGTITVDQLLPALPQLELAWDSLCTRHVCWSSQASIGCTRRNDVAPCTSPK